MSDGTRATVDLSGWTAALERLAGPARISLARSMAVAGGEVLRDEAKAFVNRNSGNLAESIYLAFRDKISTETSVHYSVTWNKSKAPHGHLVEFGYWQVYRVLKLPDGRFVTDLKTKLKTPKWIPAKPFLRPAFNSAGSRAQQAMVARGRLRLPELLAETNGGADGTGI